MSPEQTIQNTLRDLPSIDRVTALMASLIDESDAAMAVACLIGAAAVMARRLPPADRLAIAWIMLERAQEIDAKWN
jgi:hypothetical protein